MKYWVSEIYSVIIHDNNTIEELKTFVRWPNGTWKAMLGLNIFDDRVMSLIWALMILETDITEQYFEIVEVDKNNKPAVINSLDYDIKYFSQSLSLYNDENPDNDYSILPVYMESETIQDSDPEQTYADMEMDALKEQGWSLI